MRRRTLLPASFLLLAARFLVAQIPSEQRIPIRDPDRLEALGFPRDAQNVYLWSKADLKASLLKRSEDFRPARPETFGTTHSGYSSVLGYQLEGLTTGFAKVASLTAGTYCEAPSTSSVASAQIQVPEGAQLQELRWWARRYRR